jgi:Leucine-rich repeat (LRR) protein
MGFAMLFSASNFSSNTCLAADINQPEKKANILVTSTNIDMSSKVVDSNLERAIRESLNKIEGPLYQDDLDSIKFIGVLNDGIINDLSGLEYLRNLEEIRVLHINGVKDLSPLANLKSLEYLTLEFGDIEDLSPLSKLENLKELNLIGNNVKDIEPISNLKNLDSIDL